MRTRKTIKNQDVEFWSWRGFAWSVFGSPKALGDGKPAQQIQVTGDGMQQRSVVIARDIAIGKGDDVSLVYARKGDDPTGYLVGVVNHTRGTTLAMPQHNTPLRLSLPGFGSFIRRVENLTLFGAAALLSACLGLIMHVCYDLRLSLPVWTVIGLVEILILSVMVALVNAWEKDSSRRLLGETTVLLRRMVYDNVRVKGPSGTKVRTIEGGSKFLRGNNLAAT